MPDPGKHPVVGVGKQAATAAPSAAPVTARQVGRRTAGGGIRGSGAGARGSGRLGGHGEIPGRAGVAMTFGGSHGGLLQVAAMGIGTVSRR